MGHLGRAAAGRLPPEAAWGQKSEAMTASLSAVSLESPQPPSRRGSGHGSPLLARVGVAFLAKGVWVEIKKDNKIN